MKYVRRMDDDDDSIYQPSPLQAVEFVWFGYHKDFTKPCIAFYPHYGGRSNTTDYPDWFQALLDKGMTFREQKIEGIHQPIYICHQPKWVDDPHQLHGIDWNDIIRNGDYIDENGMVWERLAFHSKYREVTGKEEIELTYDLVPEHEVEILNNTYPNLNDAASGIDIERVVLTVDGKLRYQPADAI